MDHVKLPSYAKINLTLDVSRLRPDGYHDIDSVAVVIDLSDELEVYKVEGDKIEVCVESGDAPSGMDNLVHRAAETFFRETGIRGGARFTLRKRIPVQAGLGGGSSNAAAAIAALNRLYESRLLRTDMRALAQKVGSDVALFIVGGTVRMRGRGDLVEPLPNAPEINFVVVKSSAGVSTTWAYARLDECDRVSGSGSDRAERAIRSGDRAALISSLSNDFDVVIRALVPEITAAKDRLLDVGAEVAMLAGSGSAVFGVFGSKDSARMAANTLRGDFHEVFACRTLTRAETGSVWWKWIRSRP